MGRCELVQHPGVCDLAQICGRGNEVALTRLDFSAGLSNGGEHGKLQRRNDVVAPPKQPVLAVDPLERFVVLADVFRRAQEQESAGPESKMKSRNDPGLKITAEIDQQIAARNKVKARKRR